MSAQGTLRSRQWQQTPLCSLEKRRHQECCQSRASRIGRNDIPNRQDNLQCSYMRVARDTSVRSTQRQGRLAVRCEYNEALAKSVIDRNEFFQRAAAAKRLVPDDDDFSVGIGLRD